MRWNNQPKHMTPQRGFRGQTKWEWQIHDPWIKPRRTLFRRTLFRSPRPDKEEDEEQSSGPLINLNHYQPVMVSHDH